MSDSILDPAAPAPPRFALSIVIPVYQGAASIGELVAALEELQIPGGHEIVLVNDGSPDNSLAVCRALVEQARIPITLVDLARNYGEHNAVMAGLRHASGAKSSTPSGAISAAASRTGSPALCSISPRAFISRAFAA